MMTVELQAYNNPNYLVKTVYTKHLCTLLYSTVVYALQMSMLTCIINVQGLTPAGQLIDMLLFELYSH